MLFSHCLNVISSSHGLTHCIFYSMFHFYLDVYLGNTNILLMLLFCIVYCLSSGMGRGISLVLNKFHFSPAGGGSSDQEGPRQDREEEAQEGAPCGTSGEALAHDHPFPGGRRPLRPLKGAVPPSPPPSSQGVPGGLRETLLPPRLPKIRRRGNGVAAHHHRRGQESFSARPDSLRRGTERAGRRILRLGRRQLRNTTAS